MDGATLGGIFVSCATARLGIKTAPTRSAPRRIELFKRDSFFDFSDRMQRQNVLNGVLDVTGFPPEYGDVAYLHAHGPRAQGQNVTQSGPHQKIRTAGKCSADNCRANHYAATDVVLRTDNALVYASKLYRRLARCYGLSQEFILPHTPEQNGVAESFMGTLKLECVRQHRFETYAEAKATIDAWIPSVQRKSSALEPRDTSRPLPGAIARLMLPRFRGQGRVGGQAA